MIHAMEKLELIHIGTFHVYEYMQQVHAMNGICFDTKNVFGWKICKLYRGRGNLL